MRLTHLEASASASALPAPSASKAAGNVIRERLVFNNINIACTVHTPCIHKGAVIVTEMRPFCEKVEWLRHLERGFGVRERLGRLDRLFLRILC